MSMRSLNRLWIGAYLLIAMCFGVILYVNEVRKDDQRDLIECLNAQNLADQRRTLAIAEATDRERAAEKALVDAPGPQTRAAVAAAYRETDKIRAANPAPAVRPCK